MTMISLNLPKAELKIKWEDGGLKVFDALRNKYVRLTPEEWVRQNFVAYLVNHLGYPSGLMGNEISLTQNGIKRRCDTIVADSSGKPLIIIEYKAPDVEISQEVFNQICRYNSVLRAKYLVVTNGLNHFCCRIDYDSELNITFLKDIPLFKELI